MIPDNLLLHHIQFAHVLIELCDRFCAKLQQCRLQILPHFGETCSSCCWHKWTTGLLLQRSAFSSTVCLANRKSCPFPLRKAIALTLLLAKVRFVRQIEVKLVSIREFSQILQCSSDRLELGIWLPGFNLRLALLSVGGTRG